MELSEKQDENEINFGTDVDFSLILNSAAENGNQIK